MEQVVDQEPISVERSKLLLQTWQEPSQHGPSNGL